MNNLESETEQIRNGYVTTLRDALAKERLLLMDLARDGALAVKMMAVIMRIQSIEARIAGAYLA